MQWMLGDIDSVYAYTGKLTHNNIGVEDNGVAVVKFKNGALGVLEATTSIFKENIEASVSIFGTSGSVILKGTANNIIDFWSFQDPEFNNNFDPKENDENLSHYYGESHPRVYNHFIDALEGKHELMFNGREGKKSLEIVLAILRSNKEQKEIKLPLNTDSGKIRDYY
jgi:predicted dehydrogenase